MTPPIAGPEFHAVVRAGLIARGSSLRQWCVEHAKTPQWARQVLLGHCTGPAADNLRDQLVSAALLSTPTVTDQQRTNEHLARIEAELQRMNERLARIETASRGETRP